MQTAGSHFARHRNLELMGLILVLCPILPLLGLVYSAKSDLGAGPGDVSFEEVAGRLGKTSKQLVGGHPLSLEQIEEKVGARPLLNLNAVENPRQLEPFLGEIFDLEFPNPETRRLAREDLQFIAERIFQFIEQEKRALPNVRALSALRLEPDEQAPIRAAIPTPTPEGFLPRPLQRVVMRHDTQQAEDTKFKEWLQKKEAGTWKGLWRAYVQTPLRSLREPFASFLNRRETQGTPLLTFGQIQQLKPYFIVRSPAEFKSDLLLWCLAALAPFWMIHLVWRVTKFNGDPFILPAIQFLCGLGFVMMTSLPDPLRDEMRVEKFAQGILMGAPALLLITLLGNRKLMDFLRHLSLRTPRYKPFGLPLRFSVCFAVVLLVILFLFGSGPGESDALVNLGPVQPVEAIKLLLVFFLASYFAGNWEYLRQLKNRVTGAQSRTLHMLETLLYRLNLPKLNYVAPVMLAMALMLALFFIIGDLGPALVLALTFLSLYVVARKRFFLALSGLGIFLASASVAYFLEWPETFYKRLRIVLAPWENGLSGGDQIAHSLWALSSGGVLGMLPGRGEPDQIPAGHTDLILSALGEEMGFTVFLTVMAVYLLLAGRGIRTSLRAASDYEFFLGVGLTLLTIWQVLLIAAGILGIFPLSGVVTPFLSWGRSSMLANFVIFGFLLALSARRTLPEYTASFHAPLKKLWRGICVLMFLVIATAFCRQAVFAEWHILQGALTRRADGNFIYQYNPRLTEAPEWYPNWRLGTIRDRDGKPLALSDCRQMRALAGQPGYSEDAIRKVCYGNGKRFYPFGDLLSHQLGIRANWTSGETVYIERDYAVHLRGYNDHSCRVARLVAKSQRELFNESKGGDIIVFNNNEAELTQQVLEASSENASPAEDSDDVTRQSQWPDEICLKDTQTDGLKRNAKKAMELGDQKLVFPVKRRLDALLPLLYHRSDSTHPEVQALLNKERDLTLSLHVGLQQDISEILLQQAKGKRAAVIVLEPRSGDVLAWVSAPWPKGHIKDCRADDNPGQARPECVDRAMRGYRPPGSTFKVVTAMAALRMKNGDALRTKSFECESLPDGTVGKRVGNLTVHDHEKVPSGHGRVQMRTALVKSCNAYFAQLGYEEVRADRLEAVTNSFGMQFFRKYLKPRDAPAELIRGSFGQGQVLATPFEMARVAATVANGGEMPFGRWVIDDANQRINPPERIIDADAASFLADAMRGVVTEGTGQGALGNFDVPVAGKTGTAENSNCDQLRVGGRLVFRDKSGRYVYREVGDRSETVGLERVKNCVSHAWFIGFAPYGGARQIAFAVLIENGGGGGGVAAPIARSVIAAARRQELIQ